MAAFNVTSSLISARGKMRQRKRESRLVILEIKFSSLPFSKTWYQLLQESCTPLWVFASGQCRCPFSIIYCLAEESLMREESNRIGRQSKWKCGIAGEIKSAEGKVHDEEIHKFQDKMR